MTTDDRTFELMNLAIDGQASPAQLAELQQILVTSVDARLSYESLQNLAGELDSNPILEPPPSMKEEILTALRGRHSVLPFSSRSKKRLWAAAAAAGFLAIALAAIISREGVDPRSAGATMASPAAQGTTAESANGASLEVVVQEGVLDVTASGPASAEVVWDPAAFSLLATSPQLSDTPRIAQTGKLTLGAAGSLRLRLSSKRAQGESESISVTDGGRELVRVTVPAE